MITRLFIIISLWFLGNSKIQSQIINSRDLVDVYRFAEYLENDEDYSRAAGEYLRYVFLNKQSSNDTIILKAANCYAHDNKWHTARKYYTLLIDSFNKGPYLDKCYYNNALTYNKEKEFSRSSEYISQHLASINSVEYINKSKQLIALNYLNQYDWEMALLSLNEINSISQQMSFINSELLNIANQGKDLKNKSPVLAGVLSGLIPGSGKIYTKKSKDAIYSITLIGLSAWQAYSGFDDKGIKSVKGWMYASAGLVFYTGNIYGSVVSAKIYNTKQNQELVKKINIVLNF